MPARSISPPARLRRKPMLLADVHLLAAGARLLGERRVDHALRPRRARRRPAPNRPSSPCGRRKPWRNGPPRGQSAPPAKRPTYPCRAGGRAWAARRSSARPSSSRSRCCVVLVPPCVASPGGLLRTNACGSSVDDHVAHELHFFLGQRLALALRPARSAPAPRRPAGRGFPARPRSGRPGRPCLPLSAQLPGPRPARDDVEADVRHVPLEPAVEPDAVVVLVDGEGACLGHAPRPSEARPPRPAQYSNACALQLADQLRRPGTFPLAGIAVLLRAADPPALARAARPTGARRARPARARRALPLRRRR